MVATGLPTDMKVVQITDNQIQSSVLGVVKVMFVFSYDRYPVRLLTAPREKLFVVYGRSQKRWVAAGFDRVSMIRVVTFG